jgi:ATP-dependent Clp protease ATP-binding subunit ClpA
MSSYNRYSHHARRALSHARLLTARFHQPRVDTGHLLAGVALSKGSIGHSVLTALQVDPDRAVAALQSLTMPLGEPIDDPPYDAALDIALDFAADESGWLGHHYIGTEHLLLGITRTNVGNASDLLRLLDIPPEQVRNRVRRVLYEGAEEYNLELTRRDASLSELSRRVINAAEQKAVSLDHETVGLGHLILVMLRERRSFISRVLQALGLDEARAQSALDQREETALVSIEETLLQAVEYAQDMGSHYTGTEHLLIALTMNAQGAAALNELGISASALLDAIEEQLARNE